MSAPQTPHLADIEVEVAFVVGVDPVGDAEDVVRRHVAAVPRRVSPHRLSRRPGCLTHTRALVDSIIPITLTHTRQCLYHTSALVGSVNFIIQ